MRHDPDSTTSNDTILAELHTHSTASDGELAPDALAALCASRGVQLWSLTDHDTLDGVAEAAAAAARLGIRFIAGLEMSAQSEGRSIHVLGYGVDTEDEALLAFLRERLELRRTRMARMIERLNARRIAVRIEHVTREAGGDTLARPHLAKALVRLGYARDVAQAFDRWLGHGKPAYVQSPWPAVAEAIARIHDAGGVAILAHPGLYDQDQHIDAWFDAGLDGIEVDHPGHKRHQAIRYTWRCEQREALMTASSDFHGASVYPERLLGHVRLSRAWADALLARCGQPPMR